MQPCYCPSSESNRTDRLSASARADPTLQREEEPQKDTLESLRGAPSFTNQRLLSNSII